MNGTRRQIVAWIDERIKQFVMHLLSSDPVLLSALAQAMQPHLARLLLEKTATDFDVRIVKEVVPKVGVGEDSVYTVYECLRPATHWFFVDFSNARNGDSFHVKLYFQVAGEMRLHEFHEISDQLVQPAITLPARFAPGCRLEIAQTRGLSKPIAIEIRGRYERS